MPEKLDRCVDKVKGDKGVDSAYAICNDSLKEGDDAILGSLDEAVAIGGGLSAQSIGGKKINELECESCQVFDGVIKALRKEKP